MFLLQNIAVHKTKAVEAWNAIRKTVMGTVWAGDVENVSPASFVCKTPFSFAVEPDGLLLASIVPQHIDSGSYTVVWVVNGDHYFYYGESYQIYLNPGVLLAFYDGRLHSLIPSEYNVSLVLACFYWDFASPISARKFFETFVDDIV